MNDGATSVTGPASTRWLLGAVVMVVAVVAGAGLGPAGWQSLPLSSYPMYADDRPDTVSFPTIAVVRGDDTEVLAAGAALGTDDPLVAAGRLRDAIRLGGSVLQEMCDRVADDVAAPGDVEIALERHDLSARLAGDESLVDRTVAVRCWA